VIAGQEGIKEKTFTVMARSVRTSRVDPAEQVKSIYAQNPDLKGKANILREA
jgi:hypothetical protein